MITGISFLLALLLSLVHLYGTRWKLLQVIPRSKWLSFGSGISVAYVFIHLLPELQKWQIEVVQKNDFKFFSNHLYLVALLGLIIFYGLEEAVTKMKKNKESEKNLPGIFWIHMGSFTIYNAIIGYLLLGEGEENTSSIVFFFIAMAFHFIVNDYALWIHYKRLYEKRGRWVATGGIFIGWLAGYIFEISELVVAILFSFVAGSILLNILKEEMPEAKESKFTFFVLGASIYTVMLFIFEYF